MKTSLFSILLFLFSFYACDDKFSNSKNSKNSKILSNSENQEKKIVDLSHVYSDETIYWVTAKEFKLDTVFKGETDKG